ncbi:hypothetical protein QWY84_11870 [Aquisalimonas lutea]|uniref:hypothetical protein n=1 Tax=Aquisalimonas lutea TaxID=1327750 RepID=UPI0025B59033|nr:hypothetical protein [Aquisalimonas lutea]MDN3518311.1 hypothetical protein [Aquisalimonas lutea]
MAIPQKSHVQKVLEPYHSTLLNIVSGAWAKWQSAELDLPPASSRTRACVVWDAMIDRALDAFDDDPRVVVVSRFQTYYFLIDDQVGLRFKKGDEAGLSRNYPTQTALDFHEPDSDLFGTPDKVEVVYGLDRTESELSQVLVVARNGDQVAWAYDLTEMAAADVIDLPVEQPTPQHDARRVIRLKDDNAGSERNEESGDDG